MIDLEKMADAHKKLFPNATAESQLWKMEEEIQEFEEAIRKRDDGQFVKEHADIIIVCGGLYRWFPKTAKAIYDYYGCHKLIEKEVNRKWQINLKRKWEWNGKTYHHVGDDE